MSKMENLVGLISRFYVTEVREQRFCHAPTNGSPTGFYLELRISAAGIDECELAFGPALTTDITGGRYQEVPDQFGETWGQYWNRIEYVISGTGISLQVTGPLLKREEYPAVFPIVKRMDELLTGVGLSRKENKENMVYAKPVN